jgi:hypothetical protein
MKIRGEERKRSPRVGEGFQDDDSSVEESLKELIPPFEVAAPAACAGEGHAQFFPGEVEAEELVIVCGDRLLEEAQGHVPVVCPLAAVAIDLVLPR